MYAEASWMDLRSIALPDGASFLPFSDLSSPGLSRRCDRHGVAPQIRPRRHRRHVGRIEQYVPAHAARAPDAPPRWPPAPATPESLDHLAHRRIEPARRVQPQDQQVGTSPLRLSSLPAGNIAALAGLIAPWISATLTVAALAGSESSMATTTERGRKGVSFFLRSKKRPDAGVNSA
jgi:hypothetical protein